MKHTTNAGNIYDLYQVIKSIRSYFQMWPHADFFLVLQPIAAEHLKKHVFKGGIKIHMRGPNISDKISPGGGPVFFIKIGLGRPILWRGRGPNFFVTDPMHFFFCLRSTYYTFYMSCKDGLFLKMGLLEIEGGGGGGGGGGGNGTNCSRGTFYFS